MNLFFNQLINGLHVGSIYALIALGYTMVYGIVKLINFAHGDIIMVGAYTAVITLATLGWSTPAALFSAIVACVVFGVLIERLAYKPLRRSPRISSLITAIGVSMLLQNAALLVFGAQPRPFPTILSMPPLRVHTLQISFNTVLTIVVSGILMVFLQGFVQMSKTGKAMRAVSEDYNTAQLMGINVNNTITTTFVIGCTLAGIGSFLYCMAYPSVYPTLGALPGLKAFIAAVLGGIGIIPGAMLGGFVMGVAESLTKAYISSQLSDAVVYGILIIVLMVKPAGLLGKKMSEKV
ncbi:MAG: branched-chain amino acid ABC transporter permease [Eubacteriales bacterium]|jgi:branched-chain amino acid transport system permease protein|nr:branched-chain amino acid ABC transporter permease [Eubacteriales bacterium]MDD4133910.1 branched-chain amino acid ABC transporter permease [Eubacteriales bacterium]NLO14256.1 branched-chain amino acid ABC transporter permease [Clostridiales bacterium]